MQGSSNCAPMPFKKYSIGEDVCCGREIVVIDVCAVEVVRLSMLGHHSLTAFRDVPRSCGGGRYAAA